MKPGIGFSVCGRFIAILAIAMGACSREPGMPCGNDRCPEGYGCEQDMCVLPALYGVWSSGPGNVFAVGQAGTVLHYDGYSWQEMASPTHASLHGVWGSGPGNVFVVPDDVFVVSWSYAGDRAIALHYDGQSWRDLQFPGDPIWPEAVWESGPEAVPVWSMAPNGTAHPRMCPWLATIGDVRSIGPWGCSGEHGKRPFGRPLPGRE